MARYRVYLSDDAEFVQKTVVVECSNDNEAIDHARTLIKAEGQVELWGSETTTGPLVGSLQLHPGVLSSAWVRRIRSSPVSVLSGERDAFA